MKANCPGCRVSLVSTASLCQRPVTATHACTVEHVNLSRTATHACVQPGRLVYTARMTRPTSACLHLAGMAAPVLTE